MDEEETRGDHHHGIAYYEYAIGSTPNGTDVISFLGVGFNTHIIATNLTLVSGFTYYATVVAYDYVGLSMTAISEGVTIDSTPPTIGIVTIGYSDVGHADYQSEITVQAYFKGFNDYESGIKEVYWAVGTVKGQADIKGFELAQELDEAYTESALTDIKDGQTIYVTARVGDLFTFTTCNNNKYVCIQLPQCCPRHLLLYCEIRRLVPEFSLVEKILSS